MTTTKSKWKLLFAQCLGMWLLFDAGSALAGNVQFSTAQPAVSYPSPAKTRMVTTDAQPSAAAQQTWAPAPNVYRAIMSPVTVDASHEAIAANQGRLPTTLNSGIGSAVRSGAARIGGDANPLGPASISELARSLRNNPDLIYQFVRNNIESYPVWGIQKGALGTVLDNQGTSMDQAMLMVELLRASGYSAKYVRGVITLSAQQFKDWYGFDTSSVCGVINLLGQGQIPIYDISASTSGSCPGLQSPTNSVSIEHVWVTVVIGGVSVVFDPSYKPHKAVAGIDIGSAAGYAASAYYNSGVGGASATTDYVQGINRTNVRNNLSSHASNLARWLRTNKPTAGIDDVLGGQVIVPYLGDALRQSVLPYQSGGYSTVEMGELPTGYRPTLRIRYQGIDRTFTSDAIYGKRLTVSFSGGQPSLRLDGTVLDTGTAVANGANSTITFTVTHNAYADRYSDHEFQQQIKGGGTYLIANAWGPTGRGLSQLFASQLSDLRAGGGADDSEGVLGSSLGVIAAQWTAQNTQVGSMAERVAGASIVHHHQVGIAGYNGSSYVDLPSNSVAMAHPQGNIAQEDAMFANWGMHLSILESTAVNQSTGVPAVSTVKLLDMAVANGQRIYNLTASNYGALKGSLSNCSVEDGNFTSYLSSGLRIITPANCALTEGAWRGTGYFTVGPRVIGSVISGGLSGGFSSAPQSSSATNTNTFANSKSQDKWYSQYTGKTYGDPVDMVHGNYLFDREDMSVGVGEFPATLNFQRLYSSGLRAQDGPLGKGWNHNQNISIAVGSDGFQGLGEQTALSAVGAIVEIKASHDLLLDSARPLGRLMVAAVGQRWFGDQLVDNVATVKRGLNGEMFARLPDGSYSSPRGNSARLIKNGDGTWTHESKGRTKLQFDSTGKATALTMPSGLQVKYSYAGNNLSRIENSLGRWLSMAYSGDRISQVSDHTGRAIKYSYDAAGNLSTFTDAANAVTRFEYDLPGRMTRFFKIPRIPIVFGECKNIVGFILISAGVLIAIRARK